MSSKFISFLSLSFFVFSNFFSCFAQDSWTWEIISTNSWSIQSWSIIQSQTWNLIDNLFETWSISSETWSENIVTEIPEIIINFQNPSYLIDKDQILESYHCDTNKDECKVNFKIEIDEKIYACENNFSFITWEEEKCNPNTIIFPSWTSQVKFKIYEKLNSNNFKEKIINIINEKNNPENDSGNSWSLEDSWNPFSNSGSQDNSWEILEIPDVEIEIQSWLEKSDEIYSCKNLDCKVNLNLENIFTWAYDFKNYACEWNFWSWTFSSSWIQNKCNPSYVSFGTWNHEIIAKVFEKNNTLNFKTWSLSFVNGINIQTIWEAENNWSWNINDWSNTWNLEIPDVEIEIQSWLEKSDEIYSCKNLDCKVNLNLENIFTWAYDFKNYACEWNFWSWTFSSSWIQNKCNPSYVSFGTWNHEIIAKVFEKNNTLNFKTWSLNFVNEINIQDNWEWENNWSWSTNSWDLILPNIKINFQSPSYLLEKEFEKNEYFCDKSKKDCKVNFDLSESFSWFTEKNYICEIDFWFDDEKSDKCNPNTIIYPKWSHIVNFIIFEKNNLKNFIKKEIIINNLDKIPENSNLMLNLNKDERNIIMQSGAKQIWENYYICNDEICKINLNFSKKKWEICKWDFWNANFKEKYRETCNPWFVYFWIWEHNIYLQVFDESLWNYKEFRLILKNNFLEERRVLPFSGKIKVQWKLSKNKELSENKLICKNSKTCSINFIAEFNKELNKKSLNFYWDFWNGKNFNWYNPKTISYFPWEYVITLKISDNYWLQEETYFFVEVDEKEENLDFINTDIINYIKLKNAYPNPKKDESEYIIIKNNYFLPINLKWLQIDDVIWSGSKAYNFKKSYYLFPFQSKKLYKNDTKINLNNSYDEINLVYNDKIIDKIEWNFKTKKSMILSKNNSINYSFNLKEEINSRQEKINKSYQKEQLKEFNNLVKEILKEPKNNKTKTKKSKKEKQEKIITYKTSKLKSGLKLTWNTFPNSEINLKFIDNNYKTIADWEWKYKFLITNNLKVWKYKLYFQVTANWKNYDYESSRFIEINEKYLNDLNAYKLKKSKTKKKKLKKIKAQKNPIKKIKYEIKSLKTIDDLKEKQKSNNNILVFLTTMLTWSLGFLAFRKFN